MSTKSTRSSGSQHNARGVTQGVTLVAPKTGLPIDVVVDTNGVKRLAVESLVTLDAQNITVAVELDAANDSVAVADPNTGAHIRVETNGSINSNVEVDAADGDNIAISDGTNSAAVTINQELKVKDTDTSIKLDTLIAKDFATSAKQDLLLAELQLKADLTETQPVSAASLPLPAGAATSAKQDLLLTELQLKADLTETQPVSAASLPLPALASTSTKQSDGSQKTQIVDGDGLVYGPSIVSGVNTLPVAQSATNYIVSSLNSTSVQLAVSETFTGVVETAFNQQSFSILLVSDQPGTLNILQYIDEAGTQLIQTITIEHLAGVPIARSGVINGNFIRVTYKNTGFSDTTTLQLDSAYGTIPSATQLNNGPVSLNEVNGIVLHMGQGSSAESLPVVLSEDQSDVFNFHIMRSELKEMNDSLKTIIKQLSYITEQEEE